MYSNFLGMRRSLLLGLFFLLANYYLADAQSRIYDCGDGTTIFLESGSLTPGACGEDAENSTLKFRAKPFFTTYVVVVTDQNKNIVTITRNRVIDFSTIPAGSYRVYGLYYMGLLLAEPGMNLDRDILGTVCFGFTDNFVEINSIAPEGGLVTTTDGLSAATVCTDPQASQVISFANTGAPNSDYQYIVTDTNQVILALPVADEFDFATLDEEHTRVYGLGYSGNLNVEVGNVLVADAVLADGCFSLSENFMTVTKVTPEGGSLSYTDGSTNTFICSEDLLTVPVNLAGASNTPYVYMITGRNDVVVKVTTDRNIDFSDLVPSRYRIYGAAFAGKLQVTVGDDVRAAVISDACYDLSDNFLTLTSPDLTTDDFGLADGAMSATLCREAVSPASLTFKSDGLQATQNKIFLITTPDSIVVDIAIDPTIDFSFYDNEELHVWCLAYTGSLFLQPGDRLESVMYASECAQLSNNAVVVTQVFLNGGGIRLDNGEVEQQLCYEADLDSVFHFDLSDLSGGETALFITDTDGNIIDIQTGDSIRITRDLPLNFQVYGLIYAGDLRLNLGNNINNNILSDECFELTTNFVSFTIDQVEGSSISLSDGSVRKDVCVMDVNPDILTFDAASPSTTASYRFVLTDDEDRIILALTGNSLDFNAASAGVTRIYGVSYTGDWLATSSENILEATISDKCFDLSDNFIEINQFGVEAGTISFSDESLEKTVCPEGKVDTFTFSRQGESSASYVYLITDNNNRFLAAAESEFILDNITNTALRVWGVGYYGSLNDIEVGTDVTNADISDECYDISDNFLSIAQVLPDAGSISFAAGGAEISFCSQEASRTAEVMGGSQASSYAYLITDVTNTVVAISESATLDFSNLALGNYRVWGLAYTGALSAAVGDHAVEADLSDDCFALTNDFLEVTIDELEGGSLLLANGETEYYICTPQDEVVFNMADNTVFGDNYVYVVISPDQEVILFADESKFSLSDIPTDEFYVRGLSYNGDLLISEGDTFSEDFVFASACYDLSDNDIYVAVTLTEGGFLSLEGGATKQVIDCNTPNAIVNLETAGISEDAYLFYLTNEADEVLELKSDPQFDLTALANGNYQIWGASYSGDLILETGQNGATADISTGCFDRADNRVAIEKKITEAGSLTALDGSSEIIACADDNSAMVEVVAQNGLGQTYAYLVVNAADEILQVSTSSAITVDFGEETTLLVYGLAYNGNLLATSGSTLNDNLSDECFSLTTAPVSLLKTSPLGGDLSIAGGATVARLCSNTTESLDFTASGNTQEGTYYLLLTSEDNEFMEAIAATSIDFSTIKDGNYHIWGLISTGALVIQPGDDVTNTELSGSCFDLSNDFVEVIKTDPIGGFVATIDGETSLAACPSKGVPNVVEFENLNTQGTGDVAFLLTDENNVLISVLIDAQLDLDTLLGGRYLVHGLTYNGAIQLLEGDTVTNTTIASGCGSLSTNQISIVLEEPVGGQITGNGISGNKVCINNIDTKLKLSVTNQSVSTNYTYLVTNDVDEFLFTIDEGEIDLDFLFQGDLKVWGLAYTGSLTINQFDLISSTASLSDDCYALSENVLTIVKEDIDGGTISTIEGNTAAYACPGDGNPDLVALANTSTSGTANYAYIITTVDNNIFTAVNGNQRDFDNIGAFRELRIWGVSYTGTLNVPVFADLFATQLSDGCFDISDNYVEIFRDEPDSGRVGTELGDVDVLLCPGAINDEIQLTNTSTSLAGYAYLIVNEENTLEEVVTNGQLNVRSLPIGDYHMYGLSYTGNLQAMVGDSFDITTDFADNCFEITTESIRLTRGGEVAGGMLSTPTGESLFYTCPFDNAGDVVVVNTPDPIPGTGYRLVITDENNSILFPDIQEGFIPFDGAQPGEYRIWGVSFTGEYRGQFGQDILTGPLSSDCYVPSDNYITVISVNPEAGEVATADDSTQVMITDLADVQLAVKNTADPTAPYRYILATTDSLIVDVFESDTVDFSEVPNGAYLIYGINNAGTFTGIPGQNIFEDQLADNCYSLSENNIMVLLAIDNAAQEPSTASQEPKAISRPTASLQLFPNPTTARLNVQVDLPSGITLTPLMIRIYNRTGQLMLQQKIEAIGGYNQYQLDVNALPADMYLLMVQGAAYQKTQRFVKE